MDLKTKSKPELIGKIPKAPDLEMHLRIVTVGETTYAEFRDFIPSLKEYGRGYWIPYDKASGMTLVGLLGQLFKDAP